MMPLLKAFACGSLNKVFASLVRSIATLRLVETFGLATLAG